MKKLIIVITIVIILVPVLGKMVSANSLWKDRETTTAYGNTGSVDIQTIKTLYFSPNIQPGEQLCISWWVKNIGLCAVKIKISLKGVPGYLQAHFLPGLNFTLLPKIKKNIALIIYMPYGTLQNKSDKKFAIKIIFEATQDQHRIETPTL